jgi:hypothetical protein
MVGARDGAGVNGPLALTCNLIRYFICGSRNVKLGVPNAQDHEVFVSNRRCHVCNGGNSFRCAAGAGRDLQGRQQNLFGVESALPRRAAMQLLRLLV